MTKTETGAPLCFRQLWQWHHAAPFGSPVTTNRTEPQRHRPSVWLLILLSFLEPSAIAPIGNYRHQFHGAPHVLACKVRAEPSRAHWPDPNTLNLNRHSPR